MNGQAIQKRGGRRLLSTPHFEAARVLIFRPASLGDTIVSLPCFHLLARRFPYSQRRVLTQAAPAAGSVVSPQAILVGAGLIDGFFSVDYFRAKKSAATQWATIRQIRQWKPDLLVHMTDPRSIKRLLIEAIFFKLCGIKRIIGMPLRRDLRKYQFIHSTGCYEYEGARLARCLAQLGDARLNDPTSWDLRFSAAERTRAVEVVKGAAGESRLLVCAVGAKVEAKDWGADNWLSLIRELAPELRDYPLAMIGSANEFERAEAVRREWLAPSVNLCGVLSPRESGAVMEYAALYLGHDSGPMHLAAAAGVPCVALFSARQLPGVWFPWGSQHQIIYHDVPCRACGLDVCERYQKRCITSITVAEVIRAVRNVISRIMPGGCETRARASRATAN